MRRHRAGEQNNPMVVEILVHARSAKPLEIIGRGVSVEMDRKELALDEIGLRRLAQADGNISFAHAKVEFLIGGDERDLDIGIKIDELAEAGQQPVDANA